MARRPGNTLDKWEVAIVKAMLAKKYVPQDIQAYFSRPTRSINHARISEIRDGTKHKSIKAAKADLAVEFVMPESPEAEAVERVLLKEVERPKYLPSEIVAKVKAAGYQAFSMYDHTLLARQLDARKPGKGYGVMVAKTWYWYENWFEKVIEKLAEGWTRP